LEEMKGHCKEVHVVAVKNECKELLLVITADITPEPVIYCVNDDEIFAFRKTQSGNIPISETFALSICETVPLEEAQWLYEPNAAVMKAGCFDILSRMTGAEEIAPNSHFFISKEPLASFPGKRYRIKAISSMNSKELRKVLAGIDRAEITTRNFPMKAEELRKKLRLKDGGPTHIFATTAVDGRRVVIGGIGEPMQ